MQHRFVAFLKNNTTVIILAASVIALLISQFNLHAKQQDIRVQLFNSNELAYFTARIRLDIPANKDSLTSNKKALYLRLENNGCNDCTDSLLQNVSLLSSKIGQDNIVVLMDDTFTEDNFYMFKRLNQYKIKHLYFVPATISKLDSLKSSYYFMMSGRSDKFASSIFLPNPTDNVPSNQRFLKWAIYFFEKTQ